MRMQPVHLTGGLLLGLLAGQAAPALAGPASLLLDINQGEAVAAEVEVQGLFLSLGASALVPVREPSSGRELWVTDGTEVGTRPLLDLCPGACSSGFIPFGAIRQVGIFSAGTEDGPGPRVWRSDGTRSGTFPIAPFPGGGLVPCSSQAAVIGPAVLLSARTTEEDTDDCGLWTTDGTSAGTVRLQEGDPENLAGPGELTAAGSQAFFVTYSGGWTLWRTDGTRGGTVQLRSWQTGSPQDFIAAGSRLFFTALEDGRELWTSDGTAAGTRPLTRFTAADPFVRRGDFSAGIVLQESGGSACFLANDTGAERELWCSDGTAAGTRRVSSLAPASPFLGLSVWRVERFGNRLLFPANDGINGNRWWTSDGRPQSTAPLSGCPGGCPVVDPDTAVVRVGGQIFFAALGEGPSDPDELPTTDLWVTDGTGPGTRRVRDFCNDCRVSRMSSLLGKLFFAAGRDFFSYDLWASDGTPQGTSLLVRVEDRPERILPFPPVALGGRALLAQGTRFALGPELWMSDGTPAGTGKVGLLGRNGESSQPTHFVPTLDGIRFLAYDGEHVRLWASEGTAATTAPVETEFLSANLVALGHLTIFRDYDDRLWRTDGTAAGTFQLTPEGLRFGEPVVVGSRALFVTRNFDDPTASLWATDGTVAGTREIAELPAGNADLRPAGASALIVMYDSPDYVLWRTDGTSAGTREIPLPADFRSYTGGDVAQLGSALFFRGYSSLGGERIWRSDGTSTRSFGDGILGGPGSFSVHAGALYVLAHTEGPSSSENGLFRSDGTEAGTVLLATVPRSTTAAPEFADFTSAGPLLFFRLEDDERGRELWRTDGTPAGSFLVRDIVPGRGTPGPEHLTALNGRLYFTASSSGHGTELWESDGTEAGTRLLHDIAPGALSSDPEELAAGGGRLFFTADDGVHGREPWVYTPGGAGCALTETALCLGGRFRVEADWRTGEEESGRGRAIALTADTGYFWFFDQSNVEVILKVLDGQGVNGHHWVFYGALSNVEYALTVTDTQTGATRRYVNPPGRLGSVGDTQAFGPLGSSAAGVVTQGPVPELGEVRVATRRVKAAGTCAPSSTRLCLNGGRFAVEARWKDFQGNTGTGQAATLTGDTGTFWFFAESNVEVVLKVLDGRPLNGKFWVFYGALSSVEYTLTVTDTATGVVKTYTNPSGRLASVADTEAF